MTPPRLVGGETGKTASCRSVSILESKRYEQNDIRVPEHTNCGHSGKHTNSGRRARIRVDAHAGVLPAPGVARHARRGRRHVRQAPRRESQAGRRPPRRYAQGATPRRRSDRSPLQQAQRGAARSRRRRRRVAGQMAVNRVGGAVARGPVRLGELGRGATARRASSRPPSGTPAEPVRRAVSEQDEVRRRAGRGRLADAGGVAGLTANTARRDAAASRPTHRSTSRRRRCSHSSAATA